MACLQHSMTMLALFCIDISLVIPVWMIVLLFCREHLNTTVCYLQFKCPENAEQKGQKGTVVNKPLKHVYICGKIIKL